jgi:glucosamine--fructose-6-phosphate aminotransferase (isomerizing)
LKNDLIEQSLVASDFIRETWPGLLEDAQETFRSWGTELEEVYLCGCGDSHHAAIGLEFAFSLWSGRKVRAAPAMFMSRYVVPSLGYPAGNALVIGISASGEVARTIEAIDLANEIGARTLAFTSKPESSLAKKAKDTLFAVNPSTSGPGLLSYLASLLMGVASCAALANEVDRKEICSCMEELPLILDDWIPSSMESGKLFAENPMIRAGCVFVAGGSLIGSAIFAAAKLIESTGIYAWAQELEEWGHLEYFCNPAQMPTCFFSAEGRTTSREEELIEAANTIGRQMNIYRWKGLDHWGSEAREALAPFGLWAGPAACAARLAENMEEEAFRGFRGGRSREEGGGASRIRSSFRYKSFRDFSGPLGLS